MSWVWGPYPNILFGAQPMPYISDGLILIYIDVKTLFNFFYCSGFSNCKVQIKFL